MTNEGMRSIIPVTAVDFSDPLGLLLVKPPAIQIATLVKFLSLEIFAINGVIKSQRLLKNL